jgi:hypothetical protein
VHTIVVRLTLGPARPDEVDRHLREDIVPWARKQAGVVSGQWLRSIDGRTGRGVIVFDSAEAAEAAAAEPRSIAYPPETAWSIAGVEVFHQVAQARRRRVGPMRLAVFCATGTVGSALLAKALDSGHEARALARTPSKVPRTDRAVTVVSGDAKDPRAVGATVAGCDAVLTSLGGFSDPDSIRIGTATIMSWSCRASTWNSPETRAGGGAR